MSCCWAVTSFAGYLTMFYLKYVPGNIFINNGLASCAEPPSHFISGYILKKFRLKTALVFTYSCALVFTVLIFYDGPLMIVIAVAMARFGMTASFNMVYLGNNELFPPIYLSTSFGVCNLTARLTTILSPQVAEIPFPIPNLVFSIAVGWAILCTLMLQPPNSIKEEDKTTFEGSKQEIELS